MDKSTGDLPSVAWFVGASYSGNDDQSERFLREGIWENGYQNKHLDLVKSMRPGERIAIKAAYTRKNGLPFETRGNTVSVMAIKATGTIVENLGDGNTVKVKWDPLQPLREWYFYTHRGTIWRVVPEHWRSEALIAFAFGDQPQDIDRFCNAPYWRERFGTKPSTEQKFQWTNFYEAIAESLLRYATDRKPLIAAIHDMASRLPALGYLEDRFADGSVGPLEDICPFTTLGMFNRSLTDANRKAIARELARFLKVSEPVPTSFEGIPVLNNQRSWFFGFADHRGAGDIDALWKVFVSAHQMMQGDQPGARDEFAAAYDAATQVWGVAWNLSTGLYWSRPWDFATLDSQSRRYMQQRLRLTVPTSPGQGPCDAHAYLKVMDDLRARFEEEGYPVHSFPDLSLAAWLFKDDDDGASAGESVRTQPELESVAPSVAEAVRPTPPIIAYSVDNILQEGCFLDREEVARIVESWRSKKNLILQGPPGTGKTWIAKRLAFALIGEKNERKVRAVQFHPNLSYEDFVRGWRPTGEGKLALVDGVFMEAIKAASADASSKFVVVIEEINRGNPAQIFGELLTLLEAGKRNPDAALELCYADANNNRSVHIPENLYVIGTMNVADRSLALMDMALRRRFAFVNLEPKLGKVWREWVVQSCGVDATLAQVIEDRMSALNSKIASDRRLGKQFCIGHSFLTPTEPLEPGATRKWFEQVVQLEILPLLDEYWFDAPDDARKAAAELTQNF